MSITSVQVDGKAVNSGTTTRNIALNPVISIIFSQDMPMATLKSANKVILKQGTTDIPLTIEQGTNNKTITIKPTSPLVNSTDFTLTIAKDLSVTISGKTYKLSSDGVFKFTTISVNSTSYTVTFDLKYSPSTPITKRVIENTMTTAPEIPTREGFTFVDWYENENLSGSPFAFSTTQISADKTLYAKWLAGTLTTYTVTFNLKYSPSTPITKRVIENTMTTAPEIPTREGFTFVDWYENENLTGIPFDFAAEISADKILYAKWEIITYTVTFNLKYTPSTPITQTVNSATTATKETPTRTDYNFVNWFENENLTGTPFDFATEIRANKILYAKWEIIQYSITYTLYEGALPTGITSPQEVDSGTTVSNLPKPNKDNVGFAGWFTDATKMSPYAGPVSADITLHAKWVSQYAITYNLDGGELPTDITNPQKVNTGTTVLVSSLPTPIKGHDIFAGWFTDNGKMTAASSVTAATTLYAKWTPKVGIELILRGGIFSGNVSNPIVVNSGETPVIPTTNPTRTHKVFKGWYDPTTEAIYVPGALTTNKKLYAKWERKTFSITYEKNGGAFSTADQSKVQSEVKYYLKPKLFMPVKTNAYFLGWFKDSGTTMPYNGEKMTATLTLYAKWGTVSQAPTFKFTKTNNTFLTESAGVTATIDRARNIIWFPLGNGLIATKLSDLTPTVTMLTKKTKTGDGTLKDFLSPQTYTLTKGGITEDYQVQVQPTTKTELTSIVNKALTDKGNTANLNFIDTSKITDMSFLFQRNRTFNGDLSLWDVSSVTDIGGMFDQAEKFNSDLSLWDVSSVTIMETMIKSAYVFNGDISLWDVSSVTNFSYMFYFTREFNSDLSFWDTSMAEDMQLMFSRASVFNQDISSWDTSSVKLTNIMFNFAEKFNQDLSSWDVSKVTEHLKIFADTAMEEAHKPRFND